MEPSTQSNIIEKTKTQNMARALYETGYDQKYVMNAIQSKGFSENDAVEINFNAFEEVHKTKRNKFIGYSITLGILAISLFLIGKFYDFQDFDKTPEMTAEAKKFAQDMNITISPPEPPKQNFDNNTRLIFASSIFFILFLGISTRYSLKTLPLFKSVPRPIEKPEPIRKIPSNRRR
jgi:hypothetical protein